MHPNSQFWFAFTYKQKCYTYTIILQGYCESPPKKSQTMSANLAKFTPPKDSQLLLYVDDILVAAESEENCKTDTLALLNFLAEQGHCVSKDKLQI